MNLKEYIENYVAKVIEKHNYDRHKACEELEICIKTLNKHLWHWEERTGNMLPRLKRNGKEESYSIFATNQERLDYYDLKWR